MNYVVAVGNPFDGTELFGPFNDEDDAIEYAEDEHDFNDWHVVPVIDPSEY